MNKEGQFFLLAAVIISVIVISLGVTTNKAFIQEEPKNFYDFTYEFEREVGEVFNYEVYTDIDGGEVEEFVSLMSQEIRDEDPEAGFIFIFGSSRDNLTVANYGEEQDSTSMWNPVFV